MLSFGQNPAPFDGRASEFGTGSFVRCAFEELASGSPRSKSSWRDVLMSWYIPSFFNFENSKRCILVLNPIGTSGNGTAPELITVSSSNSKDHKWWFKLGLS